MLAAARAAAPRAGRRGSARAEDPRGRAHLAHRVAAQIAEQIARLGVHYLANADGELRFALLSDWTDRRRRRRARRRVAARGRARGDRRAQPPARPGRRTASAILPLPPPPRLERERGALDGLGAQARQAARAQPPAARRDRHVVHRSTAARPSRRRVRYVITLDADTQLPRGAAARLVGTLAHPLNRPRLDPRERPRRRGLRHPAAAHRADPARRSARARCSSASSPARPASTPTPPRCRTSTRTSSARARTPARASTTSTPSSAALDGRVPENALLSHDLFEGLFARAALVTDVELFEEFPARYEVAAARQHRWARGDWQLLPWLIRGAAGAGAPRAARIADDRPLEDARQPAADALGPRRLPHARARVDLAGRRARRSGPGWCCSASRCPRSSRSRRTIVPRRPGSSKRAYLRALGESLGARRRADRARRSPCSRTRPGSWPTRSSAPCCGSWSPAGGMLEWVTAAQVKASSEPRPRPRLPAHVGRGLALGAHRGRWWRHAARARSGPSRVTLVAPVVSLARGGALDQPARRPRDRPSA